ncbi:hypothetical protein PENTCL1PPCAC_25232, partial [Pristionchus entomophagus]
DTKQGVMDSVEKERAKAEELEKSYSQLTSELEDAKRKEAKIMRIAGEHEQRADILESQLDSKKGAKESLEKDNEKVQMLE